MIRYFYLIFSAVLLIICIISVWLPAALWSLVLIGPLLAIGLRDSLQTKRAILRNFPLIGHFRYLFESIRPEINQYFIESNTDGTPYNRELRSLAYQRAKRELQTVPFGTQRNVYEVGYEWINHSLSAIEASDDEPRILIGGPDCTQPYPASLLNISAMSFGSLSSAAIRSLNGGAALGGFYHNTGEGSISRYHLEPGGELVWQIGTGYFGCRNRDGSFNGESFKKRAHLESVKMIELKLSQGAKPGHGGILPAVKITPEIAEIREVEMGADVISPPAHSAFDSPIGLMKFVAELRKLSGGKPIGLKFCLGDPAEFLGICLAMIELNITPDFVAIDGGEGGTGAAPLEFSNSLGSPLTEGLVFVHNALVGFGLRDKIKVIASGKILTGFDMAKRIAAGADLCNSARGFMFALGCIQARLCNSNRCPVGVATQNAGLVRGLVVEDKTQRVANFHKGSIHAFVELLAAAGLEHPDQLKPWHIYRRVSATDVASYDEIYNYLEPNILKSELVDLPKWSAWMQRASSNQFSPRS